MRKDYDHSTAQDRATGATLVPLLVQSPLEKRIARVESTLAKVSRKQLNRITPRHAYIAKLNLQAQKMRIEGKRVTHRIGRAILKGHGTRWRAMAFQQQAQYVQHAIHMRDDKAKAVKEKTAELSFKLDSLRQLAADVNDNGPVTLASCRLSVSERCELDALWNADMFTTEEHAAPRFAQPVSPPIPLYTQVLESMELHEAQPKRVIFPWMRLACWERDFFKTCVFKFTGPGEELLLKCVHATQQPMLVGFNVLRAVEKRARASLLPSNWDILALDIWQHEFELDSYHFMYSDDEGAFKADSDVHILPHCMYRCGGRVVSDSDWLTLEDAQAMFPEHKDLGGPTEVETETPTRDVVVDVIWKENPWMWHALKAGGKRTGGSDDGFDLDDPPDAAEADAIFDELNARRLEWDEIDPEVAEAMFRWKLLGGKWTKDHLGVVSDAFKADAHPRARGWCTARKLPREKTFTINLYGEVACQTLAAAWCHKMQFLFVQSSAATLGHELFGVGALAGYAEHGGLADLYAAGPLVVRNRIDELRSLTPSVPT
jgi:hypothetical protein